MDYGRDEPYRPLPGEHGSDTDLSQEAQKIHDGDCGSIHPFRTHADWASSEEEEERHTVERIKRKYLEAVAESTPVRESRGWH